MPYQIGLEFNLNRRNVIEKLKKGQEDKKKDINDIVIKDINVLSQRITDISLKSTDAKSKKNEINDFINERLTTFHNELAEKVEELYRMLDLEKDLVSEIATIFEGKIGECYTQEELNEKLKDAATRYERKIPPGYQDYKKNSVMYYNGIEFEQKYGDLIVWNQILDKANAENINKVVFVTDDNKEDWWYSCENKTIGPRAELKNEMHREANADFYMLNANSFLNNFSDSEDTKDLIENENPRITHLDDPEYRGKLRAALNALNSNVSLDFSEVEQEKDIVTPTILEAQSAESMHNSKRKNIERELSRLEREIDVANNYRRQILHVLRETENELELIPLDSDVSIFRIKQLEVRIDQFKKELTLINADLSRMRTRYSTLIYELNELG